MQFTIYKKMSAGNTLFPLNQGISQSGALFFFCLGLFLQGISSPAFQSCGCWGSQSQYSNLLVLVGTALVQQKPCLDHSDWCTVGMCFKLVTSIFPRSFSLGLKQRLFAFICCWEYMNRGLVEVIFPTFSRSDEGWRSSVNSHSHYARKQILPYISWLQKIN